MIANRHYFLTIFNLVVAAIRSHGYEVSNLKRRRDDANDDRDADYTVYVSRVGKSLALYLIDEPPNSAAWSEDVSIEIRLVQQDHEDEQESNGFGISNKCHTGFKPFDSNCLGNLGDMEWAETLRGLMDDDPALENLNWEHSSNKNHGLAELLNPAYRLMVGEYGYSADTIIAIILWWLNYRKTH